MSFRRPGEGLALRGSPWFRRPGDAARTGGTPNRMSAACDNSGMEAPTRSWRVVHAVQVLLQALSVFLCVALAAIYCVRPHWAVAVTAFPVWLWLLPGLLLGALGLRRCHVELSLLPFVGWLLFMVLLAEKPCSLHRLSVRPTASRLQ